MGKLLKELQTVKPALKGQRPAISYILESLPLEDAQDLVEAIYDKTIPIPAIIEVVKKRGFTLSPTMLTKLRHGHSIPPNKKYFR